MYIEIFYKHFQPDKYQHYGDTLLQVGKFPHRSLQQKIQRAQAKHCKNIGGIDHEFVGGNSKDRRDRIHSKYDISSCKHDHNYKHGGIKFLTINTNRKFTTT